MATALTSDEEHGLSIAGVFGRSFSTVVFNPAVVLGLSFLIVGLPMILMSYVAATPGDTPNGRSISSTLLTWVADVVIIAMAQGAFTTATAGENEGRRTSLGECVLQAFRSLVPLLVLGLILALAVTVGFFLLIVPGIFVMVVSSVAAPAFIVERQGVMNALSRSIDLTKGSRWRISGVLFIIVLIYLLIFVALKLFGFDFGAVARGGFGVPAVIADIISALAFCALWGTIQPSLYFELKRLKAGSRGGLERAFV